MALSNVIITIISFPFSPFILVFLAPHFLRLFQTKIPRSYSVLAHILTWINMAYQIAPRWCYFLSYLSDEDAVRRSVSSFFTAMDSMTTNFSSITRQECGDCSLVPNRFSANVLADCMKVSPAYLQEDTQRWNAAKSCYKEMCSNRVLSCTSPPNSPLELEASPARCLSVTGFEHSRPHDETPFINNSSLGAEYSTKNNFVNSLPSLTKVSSLNRSLHGTNPQSRGESSLELEAVAAIHELSYAVQSISVSEILPRTSDLIFVNLTTSHDQPYCLELTLKGWRITSLRNDCMHGDFRKFSLFIKYYQSLYDLLDFISPDYKHQFNERLSERLRSLEVNQELEDRTVTSDSCASTPVSAKTEKGTSLFSEQDSVKFLCGESVDNS